MASGRIYKRSNSWYIDVYTGARRVSCSGKEVTERIRRRAKGNTRREAQEELEDLLFTVRREIRRGGALDNRYPIRSLRDKYLEYCEGNIANPKTLADYQRNLDTILRGIGSDSMYLCSGVSADVVDAYFKRRRNYVSHRTCNLELERLKACLNFGVERGLIAYDPIAQVKKLPAKRVKFRRALSSEEVAVLLRVSSLKFRRVWFFLVSTGLRLNELCYLRWQDVHLDEAVICVVEREEWRPKTRCAVRTIPVDAGVVEMLWDLYSERKETSGVYVFETKHVYTEQDKESDLERRKKKEARGEKITAPPAPTVGKHTPLRNNLTREFKRCMRKALLYLADEAKRSQKPLPGGVSRVGKKYEVDLSSLDLHSLRYTFITELIARGADPKTVQALAGHKDIKTTLSIYAQCRPEKLREATAFLPWTLDASHNKVIPMPSVG